MKIQLISMVIVIIGLNAIQITAQDLNGEVRTGKLEKRREVDGIDNYAYATYSFRFGGNGPEIQNLCLNNWELQFGNGPIPDSFDVTMVTDDRSRIKDLGVYNWGDKIELPTLDAHEEPKREPNVEAIEGHMYMVHSKDRDTDLYTLFRVERLIAGENVEITWKVIPPPERR
jgi:hypothetical protein